MKLAQLYTVTYRTPHSAQTLYLQTIEEAYGRLKDAPEGCDVTFTPCLYVDRDGDGFYRVYFQGGPEPETCFVTRHGDDARDVIATLGDMTPEEFCVSSF